MKRLFFMLMTAASICHLHAQTEFGIMSSTPEQSQADAKLMGVKLIRNHVAMQNGNGIRRMSSSFSYITNFVYNGGKFPTSTSAYERELRSTIASMPVRPKYAVIENEENMNPNVAAYCAELTVADAVFAEKKIPIMNGGITNGAAVALSVDYYLSVGDTAKASFLSSRNKKGSVIMLQRSKTIIETVKRLRNCPYFNFHYQLANITYSTDLELIVYALQKITGKQVVNNELAQQDESTSTTFLMVQTAKCMPIVGLYITTGAAGKATTFTTDMKLKAAAAMK